MTGGPEWSAFHNAKNRCNRPADVRYPQYGGRGIQFRFASFEEFLSTIGPRPSPHHSLDRIDADGHYEPGNVRWADSKTQARNKTSSRLVTIDGVTKPLKEWCEERGQPYKRVWERMRKGMPPTEALAMPALRAGRPARSLLT